MYQDQGRFSIIIEICPSGILIAKAPSTALH